MLSMLDGFRQIALWPRGMALLLAGLGLSIWMSLSFWAGLAAPDLGFHLREAWDAPAYLYVALPIMALAVGVAGFVHPERAWRWPVSLVAGHQLGVLLLGLGMQSGLSLLILTLALGALLCALFAIPAFAGAEAARRLAERAY